MVWSLLNHFLTREPVMELEVSDQVSMRLSQWLKGLNIQQEVDH